MENIDILGVSATDYFNSNKCKNLIVNTSYGDPESYSIDWFFRTYEDMPDIEKYALSLCKGSVLDIGAGAGSHSLWLQQHNFKVTAIETSSHFVNILLKRGIKNVIHDDIMNLKKLKYDTLFLMMNGIGIAGDINNLYQLLLQLKELLNKNGRIIVDSTDISYLWDEGEPEDKYYGEVRFQFSYEEEEGEWFKWLYIDPQTFFMVCKDAGLALEIVFEDEDGHFLAQIIEA